MVGNKFSVLLLTEDTGDAAHAVLVAIVQRILFLIEPSLDVKRLAFSRADQRARAAMGFNCYKSRAPRDHAKKLLLAQAIVNHLLGADGPSAVFVHVDGDRKWSDRDEPHSCENVRKFHDEILSRVRELLASRGKAARLDHVALLVPFWSIESWLFQNTDEALKICAESRPRYDSAISHFERWHAEPHRLDEEAYPKRTICFEAKYNQRLAENRFPARRVRELGLSFADSVSRVERSSLRAYIQGLAR